MMTEYVTVWEKCGGLQYRSETSFTSPDCYLPNPNLVESGHLPQNAVCWPFMLEIQRNLAPRIRAL